MKKIYTSILILLVLFTNAQGFRRKHYLPGVSNSNTKAIYETTPGNYIAGGIISELYNGNYCSRLCLMGLDGQGQIQWTKKYGNYQFEYLDNPTIARWFYKLGSYLYFTSCVKDANNKQIGILLKLNFNGDTLWQKIYRDSQQDVIPQRVTGSVDGGFLITGFFQNWTTSTRAALLIKTDANGNELWRKEIHKPAPDVQDGKAIIQDTATQKIVVAGYQYIGNANSAETYDNVLFFDSMGNLLGRFNYTSRGILADLIQTKDKKIVAVGQCFSSQFDPTTDLIKSFAVKFDLNNPSVPIWRLNGYDRPSPINYFTCLSELPNGNIVTGATIDTCFMHNLPDNELTRLTTISPSGTIVKNQYYNYKTSGLYDYYNQRILSIYPTSDNGLIGAIECNNHSPNPFFIVKFDSTGCDSTLAYCADLNAVGIAKIKTALGQLSIYPNPAKDMVSIDVEDHTPAEALSLSFIDPYGREVKRASLEQMNNTLNIKDLSSGMYLLTFANTEGKVLYQSKFVKED